MESKVFNMDCMEYMKDIPDKYFDIAIIDPPYGQIGNVKRTGGSWSAKYGKKIESWDFAPDDNFFNELFRVSKNQVIWGGNYFRLPPTRCFLVWDKLSISEKFSMAMCEYAWTSFEMNAKRLELAPQSKPNDRKIHPCQKPIALYKWILKLFAKEGDKILDTFVGSGSSRIACKEMGFDFYGCEIDKEYFDGQEERFKRMTAQIGLFE